MEEVAGRAAEVMVEVMAEVMAEVMVPGRVMEAVVKVAGAMAPVMEAVVKVAGAEGTAVVETATAAKEAHTCEVHNPGNPSRIRNKLLLIRALHQRSVRRQSL